MQHTTPSPSTSKPIPNDTLVQFDTARNRAARQCALSVAYCSTPNDINSAPLQQTQTVNIYRQPGRQLGEVDSHNKCPYFACLVLQKCRRSSGQCGQIEETSSQLKNAWDLAITDTPFKRDKWHERSRPRRMRVQGGDKQYKGVKTSASEGSHKLIP